MCQIALADENAKLRRYKVTSTETSTIFPDYKSTFFYTLKVIEERRLVLGIYVHL